MLDYLLSGWGFLMAVARRGCGMQETARRVGLRTAVGPEKPRRYEPGRPGTLQNFRREGRY